VSDADGVAAFNVASNDGESSSLLSLGSHSELFPEVTMKTSIQVPTRRLDSVLAEHGLEPPDFMIIDVQGAEYIVLKSLPASVLDRVAEFDFFENGCQGLNQRGDIEEMPAVLSGQYEARWLQSEGFLD